MFIIRLTHAMYGSQWGSLAAACSYKKPFFPPSHTRICISTTSHMCCVWTRNEIKGSCDKIIVQYQAIPEKAIFVAVDIVIVRTLNNTNGNKPVIFSGIACGDTYIVEYYTSKYYCSFSCKSMVALALSCISLLHTTVCLVSTWVKH